MGIVVIFRIYCCNKQNRGHCWWTLLKQQKRGYFWPIAVTLYRIMAGIYLDNIAAFVITFERKWCKSAVPSSSGYQRNNPLTSPPSTSREEHLWNFGVLRTAHLPNLVTFLQSAIPLWRTLKLARWNDNSLLWRHYRSQYCLSVTILTIPAAICHWY